MTFARRILAKFGIREFYLHVTVHCTFCSSRTVTRSLHEDLPAFVCATRPRPLYAGESPRFDSFWSDRLRAPPASSWNWCLEKALVLHQAKKFSVTDRLIGWLWWDETMSQNCGQKTGLLFIPQVISERGESWWWWCRLGMTPDSSTRALWQSYQRRHLGQVWGMDEEWEFCLSVSEILQRIFLTCRKILRHGTSGFTSHKKEGVLWIFIALKNPSPRPAVDPQEQ
jgi:hypothetical protein